MPGGVFLARSATRSRHSARLLRLAVYFLQPEGISLQVDMGIGEARDDRSSLGIECLLPCQTRRRFLSSEPTAQI